MTWTTLTLRVETPLFSGDDPTSRTTDLPIRVPSIRGALRFWFRAVAAGHGITDLAQLWAAEEAIFGSTARPAPIRLRVDDTPSADGAGTKPDWAGGRATGFHGAQYLLGQGLWHFRDGLTRPYVDTGRTIRLQVRLADDERTNRRFLIALWAWLTWGGLGARSRRGFGRLRCTEITGPLPEPFHHHLLADVAEPGWHSLASDVIPERLRDPTDLGWHDWSVEAAPKAPLPEFPALCPAWWGAAEVARPQKTIGHAFDVAGRVWRNFRSNNSLSRQPTPNDRSPEWQHALHGPHPQYPIAVFGLPIGYYSTRSGIKAEVNPILDGDKLRRASPVWLLPVQLPNRTWLVLTHVFWSRLLPTHATLDVTGDLRHTQLDVPDTELVKQSWDTWLDQQQRLPVDFYQR